MIHNIKRLESKYRVRGSGNAKRTLRLMFYRIWYKYKSELAVTAYMDEHSLYSRFGNEDIMVPSGTINIVISN